MLIGHLTSIFPSSKQVIEVIIASPHDLCSRLIIFRIFMKHLGIFDHSAQQTFCQFIGQLHIAAIGKVTFHGVHHNIHAPGLGLIIRQGGGQLRIHNGKLRSGQIIVIRTLLSRQLIGDHAAVAHLAAGSGNSQN